MKFNLLIVGGLLIMGFYHLGLFIFRPENRSLPYFSLLCFLISLGLLVSGSQVIVKYFNLTADSDYRILLNYYLAAPIFCSFLGSLYPEEFNKKLLTILQILGPMCYLFIFIVPSQFGLITLSYAVIMLFVGGYCLFTMICAFLKSRSGSLLFLSSLLVLLLLVVNDSLYFKGIINTGYFFNYGLVVFILLQALFLSYRFKKKISRLEAAAVELQQRDKLLSREKKFKRKFIIDTFQRFKLPINNIISLTESIIHRDSSFLPQDAKKDLGSLIRTGTGLNYMIDGFIDYVNLKEGTIEVNEQQLEVYEIIEYVINFFSPFVVDKNIKFNNNINRNQFIVIADKSHLIQLVYNILDEVCRFMEEAVICFRAEEQGEEIKLIIEAKADNILFKYYNSKAKRKLELESITEISDIKQDIIQELINLQGGKLKIKKSANKSLELTVTLPGGRQANLQEEKIQEVSNVVKETKKQQTAAKDDSPPEENYILIIGGQSREFNSLVDVLNQEDYCVTLAAKKEEVNKKLNNDAVLVILDLFALDETTLNLCRQIRDRFELFELPILGMFSRSKLENLTKGFEVGINDFIKKPFEVNELKARVRTLITLKEKVEEGFRREQDFLRAQINPHFLYNALDTIAFTCQENPHQASNLILDLANYLRYSFDFESLTHVVAIDKELELVDFYLTIQQARFQEKIKVEYNIEVDLTFGVPPLILQTLVENAIKHGILQQEEGGTVKIVIKESGDWFVIRIIDDGVGMTETELANLFTETNDSRQKIGLKNVNQRLKKLYNQELKVESSKNKGTKVEFKIPI